MRLASEGGSRRPQEEPFVQAARAVALKIQRDVAVSDRFELANDGARHLRIERAGHLVARKLDAGHLVVMAHAADAEPERAERLLRPLDHAQLLVGHFAVIRNARRQTRRCRLVPRRDAGLPRQLANLLLGQIDFVQRAAHAKLARRLAAGTIVAAIVRVVAVDDDGVALGRDSAEVRVQLVLAVVAAVGRIRAVLGPLELVGANDLVLKAELFRDFDGDAPVALGIARTVGGDSKGAIAQRAMLAA